MKNTLTENISPSDLNTMKILSQNNSQFSIGGKAKNLCILKEHGFNVPKFVVIPAEVLSSLLPKNLLSGENVSEIRSFISQIEIPSGTIEKIISHFSDTNFFSVRSSAVDEDGSNFSFAGQFDSFLFVSKEKLTEKIKGVWLSAFNERVTKYRIENNLPLQFSIAVIVQQMIDAEVSGVAFGANPTSGNRKEKIISSVYGVGEGLVSGELVSDNFIVKEKSTEQQIASKEKKFIHNLISGGTEIVDVSAEKKNIPSLSNKQTEEISIVLDKLKEYYKRPQDIEFAYFKNELFILQARPVTGLQNLPDLSGEYIVWDNSNIIESYPGISSPLTFSFILPVYEAVYRQFVAMMGVKQNEIDENKEVFANMLGLLNGRVYYNLLSWYKALALLPGYSLNAEFMEKMMGVKEKFSLNEFKKSSKFNERIRVLRMVRLLLKNLRQLPKMRIDFVRDFNATMKEFSEINFLKCNSNELMNLYLRFEQTLLKKWKAPLVNDFFAMIFYGVLQKLVVKYKLPDSATLHNDLLCGAKDIISTEPMKRSIRIATEIQKDEHLKKIFLQKDPTEILYELKAERNAPTKKLIDEYIEKFGERCVGELKLETVTYKQRPENFIRIIKSYIEQEVNEKNFSSELDSKIRMEAEEKVKKTLSGKFIKKGVFNYFLRRSRELVSARENLRYERTRAFGIVRQLFCALGENFAAENLLNEPRDIFFLTKEEVFHYIKGTSVNYDLKDLIELRKKQFSAFEKQNQSERIKSNGIVFLGNDFKQKFSQSVLEGDLKGIPCCAGRVKGKVRVVTDPNEVQNLNGDILVTSSTDPGWVTLFPTASAILVERGSLLSHSAIVSREMGKPCIVGITGLLEILKTGDEVEMDGSTGIIKIIQTAQDLASIVNSTQ